MPSLHAKETGKNMKITRTHLKSNRRGEYTYKTRVTMGKANAVRQQSRRGGGTVFHLHLVTYVAAGCVHQSPHLMSILPYAHTSHTHSPRVARGAVMALPLKAEGVTNADAAPISTTRRNANSFIFLLWGICERDVLIISLVLE